MPDAAIRHLLAATLLWSAPPALAGVVYVQEVANQDFDGATTKETATVWIDGGRQRTRGSGGDDTIVDFDKGTFVSVMHKEKTYFEMPIAQSLFAMGAAMAGQAKYKATGRKKTVAGHPCDEYAVEFMGEVTQCVSKSAPGAAETAAGARRMFAALGMALPAGVPEGLMLEQVMTMHPPAAMKGAKPQVTRTVVTSIKSQAIPASEFAVPAGYARTEMPPGMMGIPSQ